MLQKLVQSHRVIWRLGYRQKGKSFLILKIPLEWVSLFFLSIEQREALAPCTAHSEILLEAIKCGKSHGTEGFFSSGFAKIPCGERRCETSFSDCF